MKQLKQLILTVCRTQRNVPTQRSRRRRLQEPRAATSAARTLSLGPISLNYCSSAGAFSFHYIISSSRVFLSCAGDGRTVVSFILTPHTKNQVNYFFTLACTCHFSHFLCEFVALTLESLTLGRQDSPSRRRRVVPYSPVFSRTHA